MNELLRQRLDSLDRNLDRVLEVTHPKDWMADVIGSLHDEANRDRIAELSKILPRHVRPLKHKVRDLLKEEGETTQAWSDYARVLAASQKMFSETVELIAGIALRDLVSLRDGKRPKAPPTAQVHRIADRMLGRAANVTIERSRATVLTHDSNVSSTLLHLMRLTFPGWTIWHLPLLMREYARFVLDDDKEMGEQLTDKNSEFSKFDPYWKELFADAFATYVMGPAYPNFLINLKLSPAAADSDLERATTVLKMLEQMGKKEVEHMGEAMKESLSGGQHPFIQQARKLEEAWQLAVKEANSGVEPRGTQWLEPARTQLLEEFVTCTWDVLDEFYSTFLRYPSQSKWNLDCWKVAIGWADEWLWQLERHKPLEPPQTVNKASTVRDVLNAGWICRISKPEHVHLLADVMHKTCERILGLEDGQNGGA